MIRGLICYLVSDWLSYVAAKDVIRGLICYLVSDWLSYVVAKDVIRGPICYLVSDWLSHVVAKDVIRGLLKTDPDERLTIREVMQSGWVSVRDSFTLPILTTSHD